MTSNGTVPIPIAQGSIPLLGTLPFIDAENPTKSLAEIAGKYGDIYRLYIPGNPTSVVVSSHALVNELCDESRFKKKIAEVLVELRKGIHDGLFTAHNEEPNWGLAHRILMPAFGPMAIKGMFDEMHDIASQLVMKWARHGPAVPIAVSDDFTRLALDTLALCSMGYRFNSYYHDELHPFISAMGSFLTESGNHTRRILPEFFYRKVDKKFSHDIQVLRQTSDDVLAARKANPSKRKDLLSAMLGGVDPKTGQRLSDSSITDNLITFLIAGHETTSGMLSFAFYNLLKHPAEYLKAQQEVDEVVGRGPIRVDHLPKLQFISAVLRETLRLTSTIPVFVVSPLKDEVIGGKYAVAKDETILLMLTNSHRDPAVYGDTANDFVPERMLEDNFERLSREFPNSWKPFGNGMRGCIGRPFAWQEALLVMALLLQNFNFVQHDPNYSLEIKETLTLKPKDFYMRAVLRHDMTPTELEHRLAGTWSGTLPLAGGTSTTPNLAASAVTNGTSHTTARPFGGAAHLAPKPQGKPISIFYGSNSGTCEALAQRVAADAPSQGFYALTVDVLDAANQRLPADHPVVLITASYEGQPPDNAAHFVAWIQSLQGTDNKLDKVHYAVFGCGHHDWSQTFHRVPKLVDTGLEKLGATRLAPIGLTDAAQGDMFVDFETWEFEHLWPALASKYGVDAGGDDHLSMQETLTVELSSPRSSSLRQDVKEAVVISARDLVAPGAPLKRHIEIQLPTTVRYTAGDYLAVLPLNPQPSIARVMRRFGLAWDSHITITATGTTTLPTGSSVSVYDVLSAYVELSQPATKRGIMALAEAAGQSKDQDGGQAAAASVKNKLRELAGGSYQVEISAKRVSVLDLLERFPAVKLPFASFLAMLPPMRVRQYSISSSPMCDAGRVTLTYSVLDSPSFSRLSDSDSGKEEGGESTSSRHLGVASSYLASLAAGDHLHISARPSHAAFHLPADVERTPLVCIAAGSGIAPFRGFVQERAALLGAGRHVAPMLLFFGCRDPAIDDLYREELDRWEAMGAVSVRRAYSRRTDASHGCKYVQDRLWHDRDEVAKLWDVGAKVFVCGSREVGDGVKAVVFRIAAAHRQGLGESHTKEEVQKWYDSIRNERYATDVFD